jgi:hypothetical protein
MLATVQGGPSIAAVKRVVEHRVGQFLNWMTLFGLGLIGGGVALLAFASVGANRLRTAHRPEPEQHWRALDHRDRRAPAQPDIRRSALLADTVRLSELKVDQTR